MTRYAPGLPAHIPSLDGLRAISILLVLLAHLDGTRGFPFLTGAVLGDVGNLGVRIFFVISGFLITTLLLKEHDKTGTVSLRNFYIRRTIRIFPAFYVFALCIGCAALLGWIRLLPGDFLHGVTYTMNYHSPHGWYLGHIWSLSVEEQFYLLWPFAVLMLGPSRVGWAAAIAIAGAPVLRIASFYLISRNVNATQFHLICDAIASGCALSCVFNRLGASPRYLGFIRSWRFLVVPGLGVLMFYFSHSTRFYYTFGMSILNLCIALCVDRYVRFPSTPLGRVLNTKPLRAIGLLSYSLYLWQQPFLNRNSDWILAAFPFNVMLTVVMAVASYYLVESPIRKYGYKIVFGHGGEKPAR